MIGPKLMNFSKEDLKNFSSESLESKYRTHPLLRTYKNDNQQFQL